MGRLKEDTTIFNQVKWVLGDVQLFNNVQVLILQPLVLTENERTSYLALRSPPFEAAEYASSLHVLADPTLNSTVRGL